MRTHFTDDAAEAWALAGDYLRSDPVRHNLAMTLLRERLTSPEPGRYWCVLDDDDAVCGFVFHGPLAYPVLVTPMAADALDAAVEAVAERGRGDVGAVNGDVLTAARFAGRWTELCKSAASPARGMRLYELGALTPPTGVPGGLRVAGDADLPQLAEWLSGFHEETDEPGPPDGEAAARRMTASGRVFVWDDGGPVAMAACTEPGDGVVRVRAVYTPPDRRGRGYAGACVAGASQWALDHGATPILYTDLGNPVSNSVYRRLGYRAVVELAIYQLSG